MTQLAKAYNPLGIEQHWQEVWKQCRFYENQQSSSKGNYSVLMPPPNVTGSLTMGHVLNNTIQDVYIRWHRLLGKNVRWYPGIDHAGIATQTKVEQELRLKNISRHELGREEFLKEVWKWKEQYGDLILQQLRSLGVSCAWDQTLFTLDEGANYAVNEVFIRLFEEGLIYRGKRIINWSPVAQSALSDEEVIFKETTDVLYTVRYYIEGAQEYVLAATVRPETIFGDVALAVNPNDERYRHLVGKNVVAPLSGNIIPVIADEYADPAFGTGIVKITPAHDPNDYEVGLRHHLPMPSAINPDGTMNELAGELIGLDRFEARKRAAQILTESDLLEKSEEYVHNVGYSERGGEPIEPYLSDQWFVKMAPLAAQARESVENGDITFYPQHWSKTYSHWMGNIRDWCISRQLWWGHRIPVYYHPDGRCAAAHSPEQAAEKLGALSAAELVRDEDVLDTWFSSWLWPMTTMKWMHAEGAENTDEMKTFLPTNLLVTGPDIIFFWVARMIMASLKFNGNIPFRDVYFTSIIRDGKGRKMSKSLGNSPNPLHVIEKYGADALRFTVAYLAPLGTDIRFDVTPDEDTPQVQLGRNFANKLWNAGRFLQMKAEEAGWNNDYSESLSEKEITASDKWIRSRFYSTSRSVATHLDQYRLTEYSKTLYDFIWRDFCDWYIEIFKIQFTASSDVKYRCKLLNFAFDIFEQTLQLLHPVMPHITDELWHGIFGFPENDSISVSLIKEPSSDLFDADIERNFELMQLMVETARSMRAGANIPPSAKLPMTVRLADGDISDFFQSQSAILSSLSRCSEIAISEKAEISGHALSAVVRGIEIFIIADAAIDKEKEREKLEKELERLLGAEKSLSGKLNNEGFIEKAPATVVESERRKLLSVQESIEKITENISALRS